MPDPTPPRLAVIDGEAGQSADIIAFPYELVRLRHESRAVWMAARQAWLREKARLRREASE